MKIHYRIIHVNGTTTSHTVETRGDRDAWYPQLLALFHEHFGDDIEMEHVNVWHNDEYHDMFVNETGAFDGLPVNAAATKIYRANVMAHESSPPDPNDLPAIYGDAMLFDERVW